MFILFTSGILVCLGFLVGSVFDVNDCVVWLGDLELRVFGLFLYANWLLGFVFWVLVVLIFVLGCFDLGLGCSVFSWIAFWFLCLLLCLLLYCLC